MFPPLHGDDPAPLSSAVFVDDVARRVDSRLYGALVKALSDTGVAIRAGQGIDADELASGLDAGVGMITEALQELQLEDAADEQEGLWRAAGPSFRHPARGRGTKSGREGAIIFWQGGRCFREGARPVFRPVPGLECRLQGDDLAGTAHGAIGARGSASSGWRTGGAQCMGAEEPERLANAHVEFMTCCAQCPLKESFAWRILNQGKRR